MRRSAVAIAGLAAAALLVPEAGAGAERESGAAPPIAPSTASARPTTAPAPAAALRAAPMRVTTVLGGLDHPWDIAFISSRQFLFTERARRTISIGTLSGGKRVVGRARGIWASGETGLMALELAPDFARTGAFYTCHGYRSGSTTDVRVARWRLNAARTRARLVTTIVRGLPATTGRHGGCALAFGAGRTLFIGTGDAVVGRNPQRLRSGGGKVLRVDARTGRGLRTNPYAKSRYAMKRRVYTYGHRNVQGLARRAGRMWSVEQGSSRDDEVNALFRKGNYGWNPVPGYNESVPMTNHRLPGKQRSARWRSGRTTLATTAAAWLRGSVWGNRAGRVLAVTALKAEQIRLLRFDKRGRLRGQSVALQGRYGRLRAITVAPGGALYVSTSNGNGADRILRVLPG
ncbi:PQQ-dependent sugar dehydrogenase [Mumia sp. zg.B53]|uniref:PQQ-dependent sugar dehydrogenase n=1 Tax=Mumia sp. zg.B53 TaxID=2855449 RepID=UPI001C6EE4CA|nr:PQQ-dependent sugar dehydrogenase [Mumia sp. zg.B53]MBW9216773.1 PQQ-dependent sugar dehydrogenase [Mumia sp. zg.B53]